MKKFLFLPLLLWSMLALSQTTPPPKTLTDAAFPTVTPSVNTTLPATQPDGQNVNVLVGNLPYLTAGGTATVTNKNISGASNTLSNIPPTAINLDVTHRWWTDALNTAMGLKLTNITGLISGSGVAGGTGVPGDPYIINTGSGGSGGTVVHPYANIVYSSGSPTINLDFDATNYPNITGITGNLTFTASNNTNGKVFVVALKKTATTPVTIFFNNTSFVNPRVRSYTTLATADNSTAPYKYVLSAPAGEYTLAFEQRIDGPRIIIDNDNNLDNAVPQRANIINLKNFTPFADPGATTAETVLYTYTVEAGTLSDTSSLIFDYVYRRGASGTFQFKIRACSTFAQTLSTCPTIEDVSLPITGDIQRTALMTNTNLSSQDVQPGYVNPGNLAAAITRSFNFNNPVYLKFTGEKQTSSSQVAAIGMIKIKVEGK